jgi:hypothetical protein
MVVTTSGALRSTNVEFRHEVLIWLLKFDIVHPFVTKTGDISSTCSCDCIIELHMNICIRITIYASEIETAHLFCKVRNTVFIVLQLVKVFLVSRDIRAQTIIDA